jgi:pyruvate formate lyase activating enzyme
MKEAMLYDQLDAARVRCHACQWECVIAPDARGMCGTRINHDGRLFTLIYDRVSAVNLDPIEKKPLYHFHPGSQVLSLGTLGCCFACPGCQNWTLSRRAPLEDDPSLRRLTPAQAVEMAVRLGAAGICWTYNEPSIWPEHTVEAAQLAKARGLYTAYVTNGMATRAHLDRIGPYLDAYRVDIKAFSREGYQAVAGYAAYEGILEGVAYAKARWEMHVECVTNVTPTINDSEAALRGIAHWIATTLGPDTPWHVTRFHPYEGFAHLPPTPLERLTFAAAVGREEGLRYIYVGNMPGDDRQHTLCPSCGETVIARSGFSAEPSGLREGACTYCGTAIAGRW